MGASVIIIGAGLGGLSAACHLAGRGFEVTVLEQDNVPGGRAGRFLADGFRFDTGPSVLTMRPILAATFAGAGADLSDHLRLHRLDPAYRARYADGSEIRVRADREAMAEEIRTSCGPADAAGFHRFVDWVSELYRVEFEAFINRDLPHAIDLARRPLDLARLVRLGGFARLQPRVEHFFNDPRLHRLFSFQALYAGLSPLRALALYAVIAYMDSVEGVWFPEGGIHQVPAALAEAATKAGAEFRYGTHVESISAAVGATGVCRVHTSSETLTADAVVINPDLPIAYRDLTDVAPPRRVQHGKYSPSCVVWHLAAERSATHPEKTSGIEHHNIHFGMAWKQSFSELLEQGQPMSDPSRLVTVASLSDASAAPAGNDAITVLEPVPNLRSARSPALSTEQLTERMLAWAAPQGYLPGGVQVLQIIDGQEWQRRGMGAGTPFSFDHRFSQSGPFRAGLTDRRLPGVVFVGSGTRPGVGVPMVLISGRLAADAVAAHVAR